MNVVLARIGKPHGLRGEVTVQLHTDEPETRFAVGTVVATEAEPGSGVPKSLTVASTRVHRGIWLLTFEEVARVAAAVPEELSLACVGPHTVEELEAV